MKKALGHLYFIIGTAFILFHLYTGIFGVLPGLQQRAIHLLFILVLFYLGCFQKKGRKKAFRGFDLLCILLSIASLLYILSIDSTYDLRAGIIYPQDIVFGVCLVILVIEAGRRAVGLPLAVVVCCFIVYGFFGRHLPGLLAHAGIPLGRMVHLTALTTEGIFGSPLYASSAYIVLYIIMGSIFQVTGVGDLFTGIATAMFGRMKGGPAKVAVVASGFFGSISGSAIANVVGTGTFTIPLMKKCGFDKEFSGAVEASASTGGQIMPPIMGTTAFLAAEMLGIPYIQFAKAALLPAVLYFTAILMSVDLYARRRGVDGISAEEAPRLRVLVKKLYLISPLVFLVLLLTVFHFSISKAGIWTIGFTLFVSMFSKETRITREKFKQIVEGSVSGVLSVGISCAMVGIIIAVVMGSGLGFRLSAILVRLAQGSLGLLMLLTMLVCIILGMGMPTTAAYLLLAVLVAPALQQLGVSAIASHMFIFYYGIISCITPPVALAAYAAAGLAGGNPNKTGYQAFLLALSGFILPFMFVTNPVLLLEGSLFSILLSLLSALAGVYCLSGATQGYFVKWGLIIPERVYCLVTAFLLIDPNPMTDFLGAGLILLLILYLIFFKNKKTAAAL